MLRPQILESTLISLHLSHHMQSICKARWLHQSRFLSQASHCCPWSSLQHLLPWLFRQSPEEVSLLWLLPPPPMFHTTAGATPLTGQSPRVSAPNTPAGSHSAQSKSPSPGGALCPSLTRPQTRLPPEHQALLPPQGPWGQGTFSVLFCPLLNPQHWRTKPGPRTAQQPLADLMNCVCEPRELLSLFHKKNHSITNLHKQWQNQNSGPGRAANLCPSNQEESSHWIISQGTVSLGG